MKDNVENVFINRHWGGPESIWERQSCAATALLAGNPLKN